MIISRKKFNQELRKEYWRGFRFAMIKVHEDMKHEALNILNLNTNNITFGDPTDNPGSLVEQMTREEIKHFAEEMKKVRLQTMTQEPCEDCVSRQTVDELCFRFLKANSDDNVAFYEHFRDLPPVTPTRKKGKWIKGNTHEKYDYFGDRVRVADYTCSVCGRVIEDIGIDDDSFTDKLSDYPYCHCGAEMESENA